MDPTFEAAADAVVNGDIETLKSLLDQNPQLVRARSTREHGCTLLQYTGANGFEDYRQKSPPNAVEIAELLLQRGAEVDDVGGGTGTALGLAATSVHTHRAGTQIPLLQTLLSHGASVDGSPGRWNPLLAALHNDRPEAAVFLAQHGAALDLEGAAGVGNLQVVESFFNDDGSLKQTATQRQLAEGFIWACEYGRREVVDFLLDKGVNLAAGASTDQTALHLAAHRGQLGIIKLLIDLGAQLEALNCHHGTVLGQALWSAQNGEPDIDFVPVIELLLAAGATPDVYPGMKERVEKIIGRRLGDDNDRT